MIDCLPCEIRNVDREHFTSPEHLSNPRVIALQAERAARRVPKELPAFSSGQSSIVPNEVLFQFRKYVVAVNDLHRQLKVLAREGAELMQLIYDLTGVGQGGAKNHD